MSKQQPEPEDYSHDSSSTEEQDREGEGTTPSVVAANQFQSKKRESKLQSSHEDSEDGTKLSSTATSPKSQHSPTPTSTAEPILPSKPLKRTKRPLKVEPTEEKNEMEKQKKKNKVSEVCHDSTQPSTKKKPFERFWTEENEIGLLNGLFDFKENGNDGDKIEFLKKYVDLDFNKRQLTDKLRRLQKRYEILLKKGKERCFKSDHQRTTYDISKKIWRKKKISSKYYSPIQDSEANNSEAVVGDSIVALRWKNEAKTPHKLKKAVSAEDIKALAREKQNHSTLLNDSLHFNDASGFIGTSSNILEKAFSSLDSTTTAELKKNWRDLQLQELEIYMKRQALMVKQFQLILDALKSANI